VPACVADSEVERGVSARTSRRSRTTPDLRQEGVVSATQADQSFQCLEQFSPRSLCMPSRSGFGPDAPSRLHPYSPKGVRIARPITQTGRRPDHARPPPGGRGGYLPSRLVVSMLGTVLATEPLLALQVGLWAAMTLARQVVPDRQGLRLLSPRRGGRGVPVATHCSNDRRANLTKPLRACPAFATVLPREPAAPRRNSGPI